MSAKRCDGFISGIHGSEPEDFDNLEYRKGWLAGYAARPGFSMSQTDRLLQYLTEVGPITPLESWKELGIYRLSARVFDLRKSGHDIHRQIVTVPNGYGEEFRVAEYSLVQ